MTTIRGAAEADLSAMVDIFNAAVPTRLSTAVLEPVTLAERLPWFHEHSPDQHPLWVLEIDGAIAAGSFSIVHHALRLPRDGGVERLRARKFPAPRRGARAGRTGDCTLRGTGYHRASRTHLRPQIREPAALRTFGFSHWGLLPRVARLDHVERDLVIVGRHL